MVPPNGNLPMVPPGMPTPPAPHWPPEFLPPGGVGPGAGMPQWGWPDWLNPGSWFGGNGSNSPQMPVTPPAGGVTPPPSVAPAGAGVLSVGALVGAGVPVAIARQVMMGFASIFGSGTRIVQKGGQVLPLIPQWLVPFAAILGIEAGADIVLDTITGVGDDLPAEVNPGTVTKRWMANGRPFVRLADGKVGTQKKDGTWKFWKPKKHIVLSSSGAYSLADFLKADKALAKQAKKLQGALNRRAPRRRTEKPHSHPGVVDGAARVVNIETGGRG